MVLVKEIVAGIIIISIVYIILSYSLFICSNKNEYEDVKDIATIVGIMFTINNLLMLCLWIKL